MKLGRKVLNLRLDRGINQRDLAKACGIFPSALSKAEADVRGLQSATLFRIARNLGVPCDYLMDEGIQYPYAPKGKIGGLPGSREVEEAAHQEAANSGKALSFSSIHGIPDCRSGG